MMPLSRLIDVVVYVLAGIRTWLHRTDSGSIE